MSEQVSMASTREEESPEVCLFDCANRVDAGLLAYYGTLLWA